MSNPYWIRLRGTGDENEWDTGRRFGGHNKQKGVETLTASFDGAVVVRLYEKMGTTHAKVMLMPWHNENKQKRGIEAIIFEGPLDGIERQPELL